MASWRELAAAALSKAGNVEEAPATHLTGLDPDLWAALVRLETLPPPSKLANAKHWQAIVADAVALARDGWAAKALALGWSIHDLFGVGPRDSGQFEGLAVWLAGRRVLMLDRGQAIVADGDRRAAFYRGGFRTRADLAVRPVLLWQFGRQL